MSDSIPSELCIGDQVNGRELVCWGDDWPDEFAPWLEGLFIKFSDILQKAEELGVSLTSPETNSHIADFIDYGEKIGIEFEKSFWEGDHVSGIFVTGWVPLGKEQESANLGHVLMENLTDSFQQKVREEKEFQLNSIDDFDEFLLAVENFDGSISRRAQEAEKKLSRVLAENDALNQKISDIEAEAEKLKNTLNIDCMKILAAVFEGSAECIVAGPVFLWEDGEVYAMTSLGGVDLPEDTAPTLLIRILEASGKPVVRVQETTVIGGWISGPIYAKGSANIHDWLNVWTKPPKKTRKFQVDPESAYDQLVHAADKIRVT